MTITANKLIPVALVAALLGGTAGAYISHSYTNTDSSNTGLSTDSSSKLADGAMAPLAKAGTDASAETNQQSSAQDADKATSQVNTSNALASNSSTSSDRTSVKSDHYSRSRVAYSTYAAPRNRTFWDKHRDKLTVAMGSGGGALIGGLLGGRRGAAIGLLAGGGGSAYYTYKVRKRHRY